MDTARVSNNADSRYRRNLFLEIIETDIYQCVFAHKAYK